MALVLESTTETLVGANDATPTFNMPATRPDDDFYVLIAIADGSSLSVAFTGWNQLTNGSAQEGTVGIRVLYRTGSSEPASYTGTGDSEEWIFYVLRFSGERTSASAFNNGLGTGGTGADAAATAPTVVATDADGMVIRAWAIDTDNPTYDSGPTGHTRLGSSSSSGGGAGSAYGGVASRDTRTTASEDVGTSVMPGTYDDGWAGMTLILYGEPDVAVDHYQPSRVVGQALNRAAVQ